MKNNKKGLSPKIILTIIAVVILVVSGIIYYNSRNSDSLGQVTVEVIDIDGNTIKTKDISFKEDDTLVSIVENNFENVEIEDGMLMTIETLTTPEDWSTFISILVNGEMSMYGIEEIPLVNGDKLTFEDTVNNY